MTGPKARPVHLARFILSTGEVSAWCYRRPRAIDLRRATWTNRPAAVTCRKCRAVAESYSHAAELIALRMRHEARAGRRAS